MYTLVLILHSWLRWAVLLAGLLAIVGLFSSRAVPNGTHKAEKWVSFFMMGLDTQLLLGLALYLFLSPNTTAMFADFGAAMRDSVARFWAVEHISLMLLAIILVHVGRVLGRKAALPAARRSRLLICVLIAWLAVVAATPWPGLRAGRPLFRISAQP